MKVPSYRRHASGQAIANAVRMEQKLLGRDLLALDRIGYKLLDLTCQIVRVSSDASRPDHVNSNRIAAHA